jgi:glyceraldehyde 3-phosphate dehydrogenase
MRIAVNGFGRIGKTFVRAFLADPSGLKVVAINVGSADKEMIALAMRFDTLLGQYPGTVEYKDSELIIDGTTRIALINELNPEKLPWKSLKIDWVVEASGHFTTREGAHKHILAGAQRVLISAPAKGDDVTIIPGVNEAMYDSSHTIVSLGSCTTNAVYPMLKVIKDSFGIEYGFMTTVHAYTNTQTLLDVDTHKKDPRRSRAAALNMVPSSTGAMEVVTKVMPDLVGKLMGNSLRVPVGKVSIIDLTVHLSRGASIKEINLAFEEASQGELSGIIGYSCEPLVSSDYSGNSHSVTLDSLLTQSMGQAVKVFGWYDNEWGYSVRLKDFLSTIAS